MWEASTEWVQLVLTVGRAELKSAQGLENLRMQSVDVGLIGRLFARFLDDLVHLGLRILDQFLDAGRVNSAVCNELGQRAAGHFAAHRVKAGYGNRFRCVVNNNIDAGRLLEGANVPAVTADDSALQLVAGQGDDRYDHLRHLIGGDALNGHGHCFASLFVGRFFGPVLNLTHNTRKVLLGFFLHLLDEDGARFGRCHGSRLFQLLARC